MTSTTVVNLRRAPYDVYIGRAGRGQDGYFGNPIKIVAGDRRPEILEQFRAYFEGRLACDPGFKRRALALRGKRLGCFCKPAGCHGDIIAAWVDAQPEGSQ